MNELMEIIDLAEAEIAKRGSDYRYTDEPMYKVHNRCVNVLFDYMEGADMNDWEVLDCDRLEGKTNFRPGCLVGSIMLNYTDMSWILGRGLNSAGSYDVTRRMSTEGIANFSNLAFLYLRVVQSAQDNGATWGEAHWKGLEDVLRCADEHDHTKATPAEHEYLESIFGAPRPADDRENSAA